MNMEQLWNDDLITGEVDDLQLDENSSDYLEANEKVRRLMRRVRDDYEQHRGWMDVEIDRLRAAADPDALHVAYAKGQADEREKWRALVPDLLAACEAAAPILADYDSIKCQHISQMLEAAIAKAKGESNE